MLLQSAAAVEHGSRSALSLSALFLIALLLSALLLSALLLNPQHPKRLSLTQRMLLQGLLPGASKKIGFPLAALIKTHVLAGIGFGQSSWQRQFFAVSSCSALITQHTDPADHCFYKVLLCKVLILRSIIAAE